MPWPYVVLGRSGERRDAFAVERVARGLEHRHATGEVRVRSVDAGVDHGDAHAERGVAALQARAGVDLVRADEGDAPRPG